MAYIYKITNKINGKAYVGKTLSTVEKRYGEHLRDSKKERNENRPLYRAMRKYKPENFKVETLEKCEADKSSEREMFWIEKLGTYGHGYNATCGGDGVMCIDRKKVIKVYEKELNAVKTAEILNISRESVAAILKENDIKIKSSSEIAKENFGNKVLVIDKNGENIRSFKSQREAGLWLIETGKTENKCLDKISYAIGRVVSGKRKTAFGYMWLGC